MHFNTLAMMLFGFELILWDKDILQFAERDHRIVLTLDKDFRQISLQQPDPGRMHGVILFRIHSALPETVIAVAMKTLEFGLDWFGHFTLVTETEIQTVRSLI